MIGLRIVVVFCNGMENTSRLNKICKENVFVVDAFQSIQRTASVSLHLEIIGSSTSFDLPTYLPLDKSIWLKQ